MKLAVVVDEDNGARCSLPVGALQVLDEAAHFTIGRNRDRGLFIDDARVARSHVTVFCESGAWWMQSNASASPVWTNDGRMSAERERLEPGQALRFAGGIVIRFVAVDLLSSLAPCGAWVRLGTTSVRNQCGPAFSIAGGRLRRGWLTSAGPVFDDLARLAAAGDGVIPERIDAFEDARGHHSVFAVADFIDVDRFVARAKPLPTSIGLTIGVRLARALALVRDATGRDLRLAGGVTFGGRVVVTPTTSPLLDVRPGATDVDVSRFVALLAAMRIDDLTLRGRLEAWARMPPSFQVLDEWLRRQARAHVAADEDIAAVVCGLFRDEARAAALLDEELGVIDEATLTKLLAR